MVHTVCLKAAKYNKAFLRSSDCIWKIKYSFKICSNQLCAKYEDVIAPILVTGVNLTLFFVFILVNLLAAAI